jgi:hypothetical protein
MAVAGLALCILAHVHSQKTRGRLENRAMKIMNSNPPQDSSSAPTDFGFGSGNGSIMATIISRGVICVPTHSARFHKALWSRYRYSRRQHRCCERRFILLHRTDAVLVNQRR